MCRWISIYGYWETSCGKTYFNEDFNDGTLDEDYEYCIFCGDKIEVVED